MPRLTEEVQESLLLIFINRKSMSTYFWLLILLILIVFSFYLIRIFKKLNHTEQQISENVIELTDENFKATIKKGISLVDFWAPWCMPCRVQNPVINQLADELKGKVKICKLNVDDYKKTAIQLNIRSIPNIIIFKEGKPVKQFVGVQSKNSIMNKIQLLTE
jgi:thioredoxin